MTICYLPQEFCMKVHLFGACLITWTCQLWIETSRKGEQEPVSSWLAVHFERLLCWRWCCKHSKCGQRSSTWKSDLVNQHTLLLLYVPADFGHVLKRELHHFSDASTNGYGQCSYLSQVNKDGSLHCALVTGKSRVAPIRVITIPRLELTAAVVSVAASSILKQTVTNTSGLTPKWFWGTSTMRHVVITHLYQIGYRRYISPWLLSSGKLSLLVLTLQTLQTSLRPLVKIFLMV